MASQQMDIVKNLIVSAAILTVANFCGCTSDNAKTDAKPPPAVPSLVLAEKGRTDYQIIVPDSSPIPQIGESLNQAARLVQITFKANGTDVSIVSESKKDPSKPGIYLGDTAFARANGVDVTKLKGWGYALKVAGRDLIIAGHDQPAPFDPNEKDAKRSNNDFLGTAKGVCDLLRQYAGTRFLYPGLGGTLDQMAKLKDADLLNSPCFEFLPTPAVSVPSDLDIRKTPFMEYNTAYPTESAYDIANNRFPRIDFMYRCHTYGAAVPPTKYYASHPEYFALVGGKRIEEQYCVSNPEFQELLYQDMCKWLDQGYDAVDIMQPDGFRACQCENCAKLYNTGSDWGEKLWILHRNLAERVLKTRPGKKVYMGAYCLTQPPPKTFNTFPEGCAIFVCNNIQEELMEKWNGYVVPSGFVSYIYNWCQNLGTRYLPMRTPRYVEAQTKRMFKYNVRGITRDEAGLLFGMEGPVYYIMGRMLDDPEHNQAKDLMYEFCGAAFGKTAAPMMSFYNQLYHGIDSYAEYFATHSQGWCYSDIYGRSQKTLTDSFQLIGFLYTPKLLAALEKDLAQAEAAADTDKVKARLALVRKEFEYMKSLARVVHLAHAYEAQPDLPSRNRLLDAIDARNTQIAGYYTDVQGPIGKDLNWAIGRKAKYLIWADSYFPYRGHYFEHLRLAGGGYQSYMENTCLVWDTKAMRAAPLPGSSGLAIKPATVPIELDSPDWEKAPSAVLTGLPQDAKPSRKTTLRALYDKTCICLRVECELPADQMKNPSEKESLIVYLTPSSGKDISYRFTAGPKADSKVDAAIGFITDVMDPRYGQYDPDWTGDWTYEMKFIPEKNLWLAMLKIPFKTLGSEPPPSGTVWHSNVGRIHAAGPGQLESSIWSATPATKSMEDQSAFGEIIFTAESGPGANLAPAKNPIQMLREECNGKTDGIPSEWKNLPNPLPTPLNTWIFRKDPLEQGVKDQWFKADLPETDWMTMSVPSFWAENTVVGDYQGYAWYRTSFTVPLEWKGKALRLMFGAVDEQAWVYINGKLVREHSEKSEGKTFADLWEEPFTMDVPPENLNYGKPNVLVVRVGNSAGNGGIWRPVLGCAMETK